jgi:hypothetical protein
MATVQSDRRNAPRRDDPQLRGRRAQPRAPILLSGSVDAIAGRKRVSLLEVSLEGARLEGADLPAVGRDVVLVCGPVDAFGTVIWATSHRRGIQFDRPISTHELLALQDASVSAEEAGVTPDELQAMADWANGLAR